MPACKDPWQSRWTECFPQESEFLQQTVFTNSKKTSARVYALISCGWLCHASPTRRDLLRYLKYLDPDKFPDGHCLKGFNIFQPEINCLWEFVFQFHRGPTMDPMLPIAKVSERY